MYFKKNWGSMAEKGPSFGRFDIFQTSPSLRELSPSGGIRRLRRQITGKTTIRFKVLDDKNRKFPAKENET